MLIFSILKCFPQVLGFDSNEPGYGSAPSASVGQLVMGATGIGFILAHRKKSQYL